MKITVEVSKVVKETKEIELPLYIANNCFAYKVFNETEAIQICFGTHVNKEIVITSKNLAFNSEDNHEITEEKFMEIYNYTKGEIEKHL